MLSQKAMRIMKVLIHNRNTPITVKTLSVMLEISERTINTYLKEVGGFCEQFGISYASRRGVGVYLELDSKEMEDLTALLGQGKSHYDSQERQFYIRQVLLEGWENYTISLFAEELYVSRQIIRADLDKAEHWFRYYDIVLSRKSRTGITIDGTEVVRRSAFADLSREQNSESDGWEEAYDYRLVCDKSVQLSRIYGESFVKGICQAIHLFEKKNQLLFLDYSFVMMAEYLCVQRKRMKDGWFVKEELDYVSSGEREHSLTESLSDSLEFICGVRYPKKERAYLSLLLSGAEFQEGSWQQDDRRYGQQVGEICNHIVSYLSEATGLSFYGEKELSAGLESFLYKCIVRTCYGFQICNPFLEDVKTNYGVIFNTCFGMASYIRNLVGKIPSEHEIAFLTLLIGGAFVRIEKRANAVLVGAGSLLQAEMMAKKIEKRIDGLRIIAVQSKKKLEEAQTLSCDIVITTIQGLRCEFPTVYVTPVVDDRDVIRVQKALNGIFTDRLERADEVRLTDYVRPEFVMLDAEALSKNRLIEMGCQVLRKYGCVTEDYYQEILYRETISSTEIGNGVAIPHGIGNSVLVPAVCIIRLKKKIDWGSAPVDIIFLLSLNFNDVQTAKHFFKLFYDKAGNEKNVELLRAARTAEEVMRLFAGWEYDKEV